VLRPRLEQTDGIARAEIQGAPQREIRVVPDPARLRAASLDVERLAAALRAADAPSAGGTVRQRGVRYALHVDSELGDRSDLESVVVSDARSPGAAPVRVRDVARVEEGFAPTEGWSRLDGAPAVSILLHLEAGANLLRTAARVHAQLAQVQQEFPEFDIAVVQDPSPFVARAVSNLGQAVWLGGLLAFGVLLYFLNDVRSPLILMTTLPVAVVASFAVLDAMGMSLNLLSMGGIAMSVGTLVDNSIICLDAMHRLRARGMPAARAAAEGAREVALPMLASTLTTLSVFVPLAAVPGRFGTLFRDQSVAVAVSQLASLVVSLSLLPMLAARLPAPRRGAGRLPLYAASLALLRACLRHPRVFTALLVALLGGSIAFLLHAPREILPDVASLDVECDLRLPPGSDVTATGAAVAEIEAWLQAQPEVERVHVTAGVASGLDAATAADRGPNQATLRLRLRAGRAARRDDLVRGLAAFVAPHAEWTLSVQPSRPELAALFLDAAATLTCEIAGPDIERARELARRLEETAAPAFAAGLDRLRHQRAELEPRYALRFDRDALWRHGLTSDQVLQALQARTSGLEALRVRRFDAEEPVVVRGDSVQSPAVGTLVVGGRTFPMRELFGVRTELAPAALERVDQARVAVLRWDGPLHAAQDARAALESALLGIELPPGYTVRWGGAEAEMRRTLAGMLRIAALSAALVFLILAAQFESLRLPLVIFSDIPLALIGVALALAVSGGSVNVLSVVGIVVLNGVVVNDSILKVDLLRRLRAEGVGRVRAILIASRRHYRPIWMTTTSTILGLVPLYFGAGSEWMSALATTVIGGLWVSTLLTLLVIPLAFYAVTGPARGRPSRRVSP
jgi:HAE1 family hydrophobic/amphiphilic exporter-1